MSENVIDDLVVESTQMMRAAAQMGRFMADTRRARLRRLELEATRKAAVMRQMIRREVALARPVIRQAHDPRFWERASVQDAARLYGVCVRYATVDRDAATAAAVCEREAHTRYGVSPEQLSGLAFSASGEAVHALDSVPTETIAPIVDSDGDRKDWGQTLADSAQAHQDEVNGVSDENSSESARRAEFVCCELVNVIQEESQVEQVRVGRTQAVDTTGAATTTVTLTALDSDGQELPEVSRRLEDAADLALDSTFLQERLPDEAVMNREEFTTAVGWTEASEDTTPATQEATPGDTVAPAEPGEQVEGQAATVAWDSAQARQSWSDQLIDQGHDPRDVRAAMAADLAFSQPARYAARPAPAQHARNAPTMGHESARTLTR